MRDWFRRLSYNMANTMRYRNGMDTLANWSLGLGIILIIVAFFTSSHLVNLLSIAAIGYSIFRCYSTNVVARRRENEAFAKRVAGPSRWIELQYKKFKNRKTSCYFTCPDCKAVYSVPKGKGKLRATCPKCHKIHAHTT